MKTIKNFIPNILTLLNLSCGVTGILFWQHDILLSATFIFAAMVFDFLDGFVARMINATSELGKQLDSLADVVSFGVLPACILFGVLHPDFLWITKNDIPYTSFLLIAIPVCSALRLAIFNLDDSQSYGFKGLPTPANAFWIAAVPFIVMQAPENSIAFQLFSGQISIVIFALVSSSLLLIPVPLMALKFKNFQIQPNLFRYIFVLLAVVLFVVFRWTGIPMIIVSYIILSLISKYLVKTTSQRTQ